MSLELSRIERLRWLLLKTLFMHGALHKTFPSVFACGKQCIQGPIGSLSWSLESLKYITIARLSSQTMKLYDNALHAQQLCAIHCCIYPIVSTCAGNMLLNLIAVWTIYVT